MGAIIEMQEETARLAGLVVMSPEASGIAGQSEILVRCGL